MDQKELRLADIVNELLKYINENTELAKSIVEANAYPEYKEYAQSCIDLNESTIALINDIPVDNFELMTYAEVNCVKRMIDNVVVSMPYIRKNHDCLTTIKKSLAMKSK